MKPGDLPSLPEAGINIQGYRFKALDSLVSGVLKEKLSDQITAYITPMPVGIIVALWSSLGTGFLSFVAGFTNVDKELYDAAAVDGVTSRFQRLLYVDIPQKDLNS